LKRWRHPPSVSGLKQHRERDQQPFARHRCRWHRTACEAGRRREAPGQMRGRDMTEAKITDISTELSSRRTGMSFQRTRLSADRTLMSVIRTSLSLIGFGFTIFQFFQKLRDQSILTGAAPARNFGLALVFLGVAMLVIGIVYHVRFMLGLRREREAMKAAGLIHGESEFPLSLTLITAVLLLLIGFAAIGSMVFDIGPFG
jgi:putative membrane protein